MRTEIWAQVEDAPDWLYGQLVAFEGRFGLSEVTVHGERYRVEGRRIWRRVG